MDYRASQSIPLRSAQPAPGRSPANSVSAGDFVYAGYQNVNPVESARHTGFVTAIIVTRRRSPFIATTLRAVAAQTRPPDQILVVDADAPVGASPQLGLQLAGAHFIPAGKVKTFGAAVNVGLRQTPIAQSSGWLWLLHDDAAPAPTALAKLLSATEHSEAIGVAGCKQRRWETSASGEPLPLGSSSSGLPFETSELLSVGHSVTKRGLRMTGIDGCEVDQGQHDGRQDVLAVSLAGALVKASLWRQLEGTDPLYGHFGDSTDFCRRAWRSGARVVVVPDAVVYHAQVSLLGLRQMVRVRHSGHGAAQEIAITRGRVPARAADAPVTPTNSLTGVKGAAHRADLSAKVSFRARRFSAAAGYLANLPLLRYPLALLLLLVKAPFLAAGRLLAKQPAEALVELLLPARIARQLGTLHQARRRVARTTSLPRSVTRPLMPTWREVHRAKRSATSDSVIEAEANDADAQVFSAELAAETRARRAWFGALFGLLGLAAAYLAGPWLGQLIAGYRITGGALLAAPAPVTNIWAQATTAGFTSGAAIPDPFLLVFASLATLTRSGQLLVHLLMLVAIPLAGCAAWFAAGALTRSSRARFVAALVWGLAPPLLTAWAQGYLALVVAHLVLPWAAMAVVRALKTRKLGAVAAAGLLLAILTAAAPILLVVGFGLALGIAVFAPGRRWYGLAFLLPSLAVGAPFWVLVGRTMLARSSTGWHLLLAPPLANFAASQLDLHSWLAWLWPTPVASLVLATLGGLALAGLPRRVAAASNPHTHRGSGLLVTLLFAVVSLAGFSWWVASSGSAGTQIGLLNPTPAPVPAAAQLLRPDASTGSLLHLTGSPAAVQFALLQHNGSALTDLSVASQFVAAESTETSSLLPQLVANLVGGVQPGIAAQLVEQGIVGIIVPPLNPGAGPNQAPTTLELAALLDTQPGLVRITEADDAVALWRVEVDLAAPAAEDGEIQVDPATLSPAPTSDGFLDTIQARLPLTGFGIARLIWLAATGLIVASYLLVALPNPRSVFARRLAY